MAELRRRLQLVGEVAIGFLQVGEHRTEALGLDLPAGDVHDAILTLGDVGYVGRERSSRTCE